MPMFPTQKKQCWLHQVTLLWRLLLDSCFIVEVDYSHTMTLSTKTGLSFTIQIYLPNVCVRVALSIINMHTHTQDGM